MVAQALSLRNGKALSHSTKPNGLEAEGGSWQPGKGLGPLFFFSTGESEESGNESQADLTLVTSES